MGHGWPSTCPLPEVTFVIIITTGIPDGAADADGQAERTATAQEGGGGPGGGGSRVPQATCGGRPGCPPGRPGEGPGEPWQPSGRSGTPPRGAGFHR